MGAHSPPVGAKTSFGFVSNLARSRYTKRKLTHHSRPLAAFIRNLLRLASAFEGASYY